MTAIDSDHRSTRPHTGRPNLRLTGAVGLAVSLMLGGCGGVTPTSNGPSASPSSGAPSADSSSSPDGSNAASQASQTDTDWGRIWDDLPAAFPVYPGAAPAEAAETGPVSATLALQGPDAKTVATWMQTALERAAYTTEGLSGPLEDGSFVLDSIGAAADCRVEVAVAPLGSLTMVTVRYGAACPSP